MTQHNFEEAKDALLHSLLSRSYDVELQEDETFIEEIEADPKLSLIQEEDRDILMHRDAHFSGSFDVMLDNYREGRRGAVLPIESRRIEFLRLQEAKLGKNLAPYLLTGADAEKVAFAKKMYYDLMALAEGTSKDTIAQAISKLILSEEDEIENALDKVLLFGNKAIPALLELLQSELFLDPLFPGYGKAPFLAALALGKLRAMESISSLFQLLKHESFEAEEAALKALVAIGEKAKEFLLKIVQKKPFTEENERAAYALLQFESEEVALQFFQILKELIQSQSKQLSSPFAHYLTLGLKALPDAQKKELQALAKNSKTPKDLLT